jgi:hypothetical protein
MSGPDSDKMSSGPEKGEAVGRVPNASFSSPSRVTILVVILVLFCCGFILGMRLEYVFGLLASDPDSDVSILIQCDQGRKSLHFLNAVPDDCCVAREDPFCDIIGRVVRLICFTGSISFLIILIYQGVLGLCELK